MGQESKINSWSNWWYYYYSKNSEQALVVKSTISDNKIIVDIPNILLQEPYNIIAYVYLENNDSGKTVRVIEIPLRRRVKPNDYEYVDNVEIVYLSDLIREVEVLKENLKSSYELAQEGGFTGTEAEFYSALASIDVATDDETNEYLFGTT